MKSSKSISLVTSAILIAIIGVFAAIPLASAQIDRERARVVSGDVCPAPELVKTHIVLDPSAPYAEFSGPHMLPPIINGRRLVPDEPQSTDEVLSEFRPDYGLAIPASNFEYVSTMTDGSMVCTYHSDRINELISILTRSRTCSTLTGTWTDMGSTYRCTGSRRACMFEC